MCSGLISMCEGVPAYSSQPRRRYLLQVPITTLCKCIRLSEFLPWVSWQGLVTTELLTQHRASSCGISVTVPARFSSTQCSRRTPGPLSTAIQSDMKAHLMHFNIFRPAPMTAGDIATRIHQYPVCMKLHQYRWGFCPPAVKIKRWRVIIKRYSSHKEINRHMQFKSLLSNNKGWFHYWAGPRWYLWDGASDSSKPHHCPPPSDPQSPKERRKVHHETNIIQLTVAETAQYEIKKLLTDI